MNFSKEIKIKVKTNRPRTKIVSFENGIYSMDVKALPEKGKANLEIIKFFKKEYKKDIRVVSGKTSKLKVLKEK